MQQTSQKAVVIFVYIGEADKMSGAGAASRLTAVYFVPQPLSSEML